MKPGLVIAIENGDEPCKNIHEWCKRNVNRKILIEWSTTYRGQRFTSAFGRPYCLSPESAYKPYFLESFSISYNDAVQIGIIDKDIPKPIWICFLTTDKHLIKSQKKITNEVKNYYKELKGKLSLLDKAFYLPLFLLAELFIIKNKSLDKNLMHLQREETLHQAIINNMYNDESRNKTEFMKIQKMIDDKWQDYWFHRPLE